MQTAESPPVETQPSTTRSRVEVRRARYAQVRTYCLKQQALAAGVLHQVIDGRLVFVSGD